MADSEEAILLRRRARRRLVGAIALVVFAVIVLPIVFDKEPRPISQDIVIQIPSQNSGRFNTKVVPPPPEPVKGKPADSDIPPAASPRTIPPVNAEPAPAPIVVATDVPQMVTPKEPPVAKVHEPVKTDAAPKVTEKKAVTKDSPPVTDRAHADAEALRAQSLLQGDSFIVPLGAYLNQANVKTLQAKVTVAGFKSYSEVQKVAKGEQIRVRAGPFPTRQEAERAREQLQAAGLTVGAVSKP